MSRKYPVHSGRARGFKGHRPVPKEKINSITYWYCKCGKFLGYSKSVAYDSMVGHRQELELEKYKRDKES